jgi:DNA polymerase-3 subunit beta
MKLSITQENLAKALNTVSRVATGRVNLPILNNIMLRGENNRLILSATNMDIAITQNIGAKIEKEGTAIIPAKLITEFISNLPKTNIDLELVDQKLHIKSGNYNSIINTVPADDFPEIPEIKKAVKISFQTDILKEAVGQTAPICSSDVTRPTLTGVYIYNNKDKITFVATDGYRLVEKTTIKTKVDIKAIVPSSTLLNVAQIVTDDSEEIDVLINDEQISFNFNNTEITSRLIPGNFINYIGLIPKNSDNNFTIDRSEFLRVIKISELFARESAGSITIKTNGKKNHISINSIASEFGENSSEVDADVTGTSDITLNAKYLLEALNNINIEKVQFSFSSKIAPSLLTGVDFGGYKHIIMPIKS